MTVKLSFKDYLYSIHLAIYFVSKHQRTTRRRKCDIGEEELETRCLYFLLLPFSWPEIEEDVFHLLLCLDDTLRRMSEDEMYEASFWWQNIILKLMACVNFSCGYIRGGWKGV